MGLQVPFLHVVVARCTTPTGAFFLATTYGEKARDRDRRRVTLRIPVRRLDRTRTACTGLCQDAVPSRGLW